MNLPEFTDQAQKILLYVGYRTHDTHLPEFTDPVRKILLWVWLESKPHIPPTGQVQKSLVCVG